MGLGDKPQRHAINHRFRGEICSELKVLARTDNWHALLAVAFDHALIVIAAVIAYRHPLTYPLAILIIGARQRALASILHDAVHGRAAKNHMLNFLLGTVLSGYLIFQSFHAYKKSHVIDHHWRLGDPQRDPDFAFYIRLGLFDSPTPRRILWRHVIAPLLLLDLWMYARYVMAARVAAIMRYPEELGACLLTWTIVLSLFWKYDAMHLLCAYWLIPFLTAFMVIGRFIEIAEHYPLIGRGDDVMSATRNRYSHWLEAFFMSIHNENFHLVHHLRPDIPFWNVEKAHHVMMKDDSYRLANARSGGVFVSGNMNVALFPALAAGLIQLPGGPAENGAIA